MMINSFLKIYFLLINLLIFQLSFSQHTIKLKETIRNDSSSIHFEDIKYPKKNIFLEDSIYQVTSSCSGEFGGTIKFLNKITKNEHSAESVCPIIVNKISNKYYVTNSLAHMMGSTQILEIENPDSLEIFKMPEPYKKKGKKKFYYYGDQESKSSKGTKVILDSIGIMTEYSFPFDGELYSIIRTNDGSFLSQIRNGKYENLLLINADKIWNYSNKIINTNDGRIIIYVFDNEKKHLLSYFIIDKEIIYQHKFVKKK